MTMMNLRRSNGRGTWKESEKGILKELNFNYIKDLKGAGQ